MSHITRKNSNHNDCDLVDKSKIKPYEKEWSMGNGQCPDCCGHAPNKHWWTDFIGHELDCPLAALLKDAGHSPVMKQLNPDRSIGSYFGKDGLYRMIRASDCKYASLGCAHVEGCRKLQNPVNCGYYLYFVYLDENF